MGAGFIKIRATHPTVIIVSPPILAGSLPCGCTPWTAIRTSVDRSMAVTLASRVMNFPRALAHCCKLVTKSSASGAVLAQCARGGCPEGCRGRDPWIRQRIMLCGEMLGFTVDRRALSVAFDEMLSIGFEI